MSTPIRDFIAEKVFAARAAEARCLMIYDPERRYRDIALGLAGEKREVIDVSSSIIVQREVAAEALSRLARGAIESLVLWSPFPLPRDVDEKQRDPFAVFAEIGEVFPKGDGDEYAALCRRAKPDHVAEINRLFADGVPSFEMIDALDAGGSWPKLRTLLGVASAREILAGVLSPSQRQLDALKADGAWAAEFRDFVERTLGYKFKTKGVTRQPLADEAWRLLLFSELVFDSEGEVPEGLEAVARAGREAKEVVFDVCSDLRKNDDHKENYKTKAQEVEEELQLRERVRTMKQLGARDTFACEERAFFRSDGGACQKPRDRRSEGNLRKAAASRSGSPAKIGLRSGRLPIARSICSNAIAVASNRRAVIHRGPDQLLRQHSGRDLDRFHRELEQAASQVVEQHEGVDALLALARKAYA
jgi:hypothetical protein